MIRRDSTGRAGLWLVLIVSFVVLSVSCATKGDFSEFRHEMKRDTGDIESRLSALEQSAATIDSLVREQLLLTQSLSALLGTQSREQAEKISTITSRQDEINYILKELLEKLQEIQLYGGLELQSSKDSQSKTPSPPGGTSQPERSLPETPEKVDPEKLYETAKQELEQKNFTLAESRFIAFLLQFPTHSLAPNAQYWLGEAAYVQEDYKQAAVEFGKVIKKYPKSPKLRAALLKIGYSQIEMNDIKNAKKTLQEIIRKHKNSEEAKLAREKLNEID